MPDQQELPDPHSTDSCTSDRLRSLSEEITAIGRRQCELAAQLEECRLERRVLNEMHEECRALREQFHEREVLKPVFLSLIGLADRCRNELSQLRRVARDAEQRGQQPEIVLALCTLARARKTDLLEVEALLRQHDVQSFETPGGRFDAGTQKCTRRVPTMQREQHMIVAARGLTGYRRGQQVIRPECVQVYVYDRSSQAPPQEH